MIQPSRNTVELAANLVETRQGYLCTRTLFRGADLGTLRMYSFYLFHTFTGSTTGKEVTTYQFPIVWTPLTMQSDLWEVKGQNRRQS